METKSNGTDEQGRVKQSGEGLTESKLEMSRACKKKHTKQNMEERCGLGENKWDLIKREKQTASEKDGHIHSLGKEKCLIKVKRIQGNWTYTIYNAHHMKLSMRVNWDAHKEESHTNQTLHVTSSVHTFILSEFFVKVTGSILWFRTENECTVYQHCKSE